MGGLLAGSPTGSHNQRAGLLGFGRAGQGPEAPSLPEKLKASLGLGMDMVGAEKYFAWRVCGRGGAPFDPSAVSAEAVRRYNAWAAIRAWGNGPVGLLRIDQLLAILDGPAE